MKKKTHTSLWGLKRQKLLSAAGLLTISAVLLVSATYAWLILSTHPEASGIAMQIGSNGSLEIALLNTETRADMTKITSKVGDSIDDPNQSPLVANATWGNLVDLSDSAYGLDKITIMPAQLRVEEALNADYRVQVNGPLALPVYGTDGRIIKLTDSTASAVYSDNLFAVTEEQTYGVRAIGVVDSDSAEMNDIAYAKSNVSTYSNSAKNAAVAAVTDNGSSLLSIVFGHYVLGRDSITKKQVNSLKTMITSFRTSASYIEMALRYGILARVGQSGNGSFTEAKNMALDTTIPLSRVYETYIDSCPEEMAEWITELERAQNTLNEAYSLCVNLTTPYTWNSVSPALFPMMNNEFVLINDKYLDDFTEEDQNALISSDYFTMTLLPGSGVMADIASFVGDYSAWASYSGYEVNFFARTELTRSYLTMLNASVRVIVSSDEEIGGFSDSSVSKEIRSLGGYAIDMAFRCNAEKSDLQLQIAPAQRIYSDSTASDLQGGGSYMMFTSKDGAMTAGRMLELMDAIRVTFIDEEGNLLAMSKLNTSNRTLGEDGSIKANLYLYNYSVDEDRNVVIGDRRSGDDTKIASLEQNIAKAVTVVVWLDGTMVDNTKVSAEYDTSLDGTLNLQFASSADLIPAVDGALYNSNASSVELGLLLADADEDNTPAKVYRMGQGSLYSDVSWKAFASAYAYALRVNQDSEASSAEIKAAYNNLLRTFNGLEGVSHDTLTAHISKVRGLTGSSDEIAGYARDGVVYTTFTEQFSDSATAIRQVDYNSNLRDEGNGILTPIYTQASWSRLAQALYVAEAVNAFSDATDAQINDAITQLDQAVNMLERTVYFEAYELDNEIYYLAITDEEDTYGKWYDADFKRIVNELLILDLNTGAEKATVARIEANDYYERDSSSTIKPSIDLSKAAYSNFKNDEIAGVRWGVSGITIPDANGDSYVSLESLVSSANSVIASAQANQVDLSNKAELDSYKQNANAVLNGTLLLTDAETTTLLSEFASEIVSANVQVNEKLDSVESVRNDRETLDAAIAEAERVAVPSADVDAAKAVQTRNTAAETAYSSELSRLNAAIIAAGGTSMRSMSAALAEAQRLNGENDLSECITAAQEAVEALDSARAEYTPALAALNEKITANGGRAQTQFTIQKVDASERHILDTAVQTARSLDAYTAVPAEANGQRIHDDLVAAVAKGSAVYQMGSTAAKADYAEAMDALNAAIVAAGGEEQTAYNVLEYTVNNNDGYYEPTNRVSLPSAILKLKELSAEDIGTAVITARILTKNGVVYTAEKEVTLFNKAQGISLHLTGATPSVAQLLSEAIAEAKTLADYNKTTEVGGVTLHSELYRATAAAEEKREALDQKTDACDVSLSALNAALQSAGGTRRKTVSSAKEEADNLLPKAQTEKNSAESAAETALSMLNEMLTAAGKTGRSTLADAITEARDLKDDLLLARDSANQTEANALVALNNALAAVGGLQKERIDEAITEAISLDAYADVSSNLHAKVDSARAAQSSSAAAELAYRAIEDAYNTAVAAQSRLYNAEKALSLAQSGQEEISERVTSALAAQSELDEAISDCLQPLSELNAAIREAGGIEKTAETTMPYSRTVNVNSGDVFGFSVVKKTGFVEATGADGSKKNIKIEMPNNETPTAYYWSVDDPSAVSIGSASDTSRATSTVTVLETGKTVKLTLSVKMNTGSEYSSSVTVQT